MPCTYPLAGCLIAHTYLIGSRHHHGPVLVDEGQTERKEQQRAKKKEGAKKEDVQHSFHAPLHAVVAEEGGRRLGAGGGRRAEVLVEGEQLRAAEGKQLRANS